ncbi:MAG: hypothetical protein IJC83_05840, partial [Oscillospiraceae bacterium]|nr:hypothetical protein [Oscillospiraceae bacterium]
MKKISVAICLLVLMMFSACGSVVLISKEDIISSAQKTFSADILLTDGEENFTVFITRTEVANYKAEITYGDITLTYNFGGDKSSLESEGICLDTSLAQIPDTAPIKWLITILNEISYSNTLEVDIGEEFSQIIVTTKYGDFVVTIKNNDMSITEISSKNG